MFIDHNRRDVSSQSVVAASEGAHVLNAHDLRTCSDLPPAVNNERSLSLNLLSTHFNLLSNRSHKIRKGYL